MARRNNPLKSLLVLGILGLAGLVGYTWYETGELGVWPSESSDPYVAQIERDIRANEKRIEKLKRQAAMGGKGTPRDEIDQEIADLERRNADLRERLRRRR